MIELLDDLYIGSATPESGGGGGTKKKYGATVDTFLGDKTQDGSLIMASSTDNIVFDGVTAIGSQVLMWKFYNSNIQSVQFPDLTKIHTPSACESAFKNSGVRDIVWTKLDELSGTDALKEAFYNTQVRSVVIPATKITGRSVLEGAFARCNRLTAITFPSLTDVGSETTQFDNMLQGVAGCTVMFPSNMQSTMESWSSVQNGFGGTNTTVLFNI